MFASQSNEVRRPPPLAPERSSPHRRPTASPLWSQISPSSASPSVMRQPTPSPTSTPDACSTNEEEDRKNAFRLRAFSLPDFTPSTGLGRFDASYWPLTTLMFATTKLHFNYVPADNTPDPFTLFWLLSTGQNENQFFWSDAKETQFENDFVRRTTRR